MKNLLNKTVKIDNFLTTDPFNKRDEVGVVKEVKIIDKENADFTIEFADHTTGVYQYGTFEKI